MVDSHTLSFVSPCADNDDGDDNHKNNISSYVVIQEQVVSCYTRRKKFLILSAKLT